MENQKMTTVSEHGMGETLSSNSHPQTGIITMVGFPMQIRKSKNC
jgi:hypothetical protein